MRILSAIAVSCALLLSACKQEKADPNAKAAGGEVLPGSVSDAMIDLDKSTAIAPVLPASGSANKDKAATPAAEETAATATSSPSTAADAQPAAADAAAE